MLGVIPPATITVEWLDGQVSRSPALWQAFDVARARGFAPNDLVLTGTYDEASPGPPRFAVMDHAFARKLLGPMLVPRWIPPGRGEIFQRDFLARLDEAARLGETLAISILVHADGSVETMHAEGIAPSQHRGQA